ncbi:integrase, catalytic region, zinc finger, CCHC-type containing protein [Tanacetum coccineum]
MDINIDALYNILKQKQGDMNDAMGYKKKAVMITSNPLALVAEKTKVSKHREKVVVQSESEGSDDEDITNKKPEYVKSKEKKEDKKADEKKRDMSKVKCYNCKKEGHFAKDCKKEKVKDYNYYKTKMLLAKKDNDEQVLLAEDQAWMESSSDSDQEISTNMVFMAKMEKVLLNSEESSSSTEETIAEVSYYTSDSESESEYETSEYYDNSTNYGLFVDNDDQEIFHDAIESASENFNENHIASQTNHDESEVNHNDYEEKDHLVDKLIKKFNQKIAKCQKCIEKENQQSKDLENQNKDLQDKYDVLKNQVNTFEEKNNEFNEHIKVLNEKNDDLLAQTKVLQEQLKISALCDNDKQHRKKIDEQEILFDKMSRQLVEMNNNVLRLQEKILEKETKISELEECTNVSDNSYEPSKDNMYNGRKRIGFENPSYFCKAKELRPSLYDERVIGLGYTPMFLTHSDEALEIEKFKRARENKIEFTYDNGNMNESYVNEKINFSDDYFQEIINLDFEKIDSPFQQTSSLKPYVPTVILEKIIIDLEDEVVSLLEKEKENLEIIESLKSKGLESSENAIFESESQSENDFQVVEKGCDNLENSNVSQTVSNNVENKTKRKRRKKISSKQNDKQVDNDGLHANRDFVYFSDLDTLSSVRIPKHSSVIWKKKGSSNTSKVDLSSVSNSKVNKDVKRYSRKDLLSCNNSHHVDTKSAYVCNDAMNVSCNSRMHASYDVNDLFVFDDIVQICLWIIDSRCSKHMTGNRALLINFVEKFLGMVRFGNNDFAVIAGYGDVVIGSMTFKKVYYVEGRIHRKHHKSKMAFSLNKPLYLLHMDLCGPMRVESINGKRYVLVVVDDYSRCYLLNNYDDVGKLKAKGDIEVFVGYSKESAAFRVYNKRTQKIHESMNVNFDEISEMASKQFVSLNYIKSNKNVIGLIKLKEVLYFKERMQKYTRFDAQSFKDAMICNMDSIGKYMLEIILHQQRTPQLLKQKKLMQTQEDPSNLIQPLNADSLKVDLVVIQNTCSEKEDSNSETASSKSVKESSLDSATKDVHAIKYKMSKAKERCMTYFRSLHSHLQVLSKEDLKGTRIEHGFKRAFMSLFGQDHDTFTSTMFLNVDQLQKQLDKDDFQEDGSMEAFWVINRQFQKFIDSQFSIDYDGQMSHKYFVEYTRIEVKHFRDTLLQRMGTVKKSVAERTRHQRQYDRRVNKRQMQTQESKGDTGKALDADLVVTESNIRPIYDEEPMAEVQLTVECNIFAIGQQHTEQPEIVNKGRVDQYLEQCQIKSPMLDSSSDNQTIDYLKQSLESENILLKKTVAQFQKDFSRMEAHCVNMELKYQNQALKSGQHEHSVTRLLKENETLKKHYKDLYDSIKITRSKTIEQTTYFLANNADLKAHIQEKVFAIAALKNDIRKLKGNSVDTKFAKTSVLGKPVLQSLRNQSVVRQPNAFKSERPQMSKQRFASQVDVNKNLSRPVTQHYLPKRREYIFAKPDHMIASSESRNSSKNMPRFSSNDMVHNHYLDEARKKTKKKNRNSKTRMMPSARFQSTVDGSKPKPRSNNQTPRSLHVSKISCVTIMAVPKADHSKSSSSFSDSKHFVCSTCHKCVFNANHDVCITKLLKEVNSHAKIQSYKTKNSNKPVDQKSHTQKPSRQIFIGHMFSPNKTSAVYEKTSPRSDIRWKPTGSIFKSVGLSAGTSLTGQEKQRIDFSAGTSFNVKQENLRVWLLKKLISQKLFNGENLVVTKSSVVTTADASDKRHQQPDSSLYNLTLATTVSANGNFDL